MESEANAFPEGWLPVRIDDIVEVNPGKPPKDLLPADAPVSFVPMPAVDAERGAITEPEVREYQQVRNGYTAFRDDDLIVAKITPCMENGKAAIARDLVNGLGFGSSEFHVLRSRGAVLPEYLYHFVRQQAFRDTAEKQMTGSVGQKRVPADFIRGSIIPLPPLAEQRRIVAQVEALLADVARVRCRLEGVAATMQRFRQAVLAAAVDGRLTSTAPEDERRPRWAETIIESVCDTIVDCPHSTPKWTTEGKICIRTSELRPGCLDLKNARCVSEETYRSRVARLVPRAGDIVYSREGTLGVASIIPEGIDICMGQRLMLLRPGKNCLPSFLAMFLNSPQTVRSISQLIIGSTSPHVNVGDVKRFPILLPSLPEQHETVRRVDALFALADRIEGEVAGARERVEALTQAVLAKAFRGELVPTEAELARREGRAYESAGVLLERVRAEREDGRPKPPGRPRRAAGQTVLPVE